MTAVVSLAGASIRRVLRDRTALFFMVALPVLVILVIGSTIRGFGELRVGLVDAGSGPLGAATAVALERAEVLDVRRWDDLERARTALRRAELDAVVVLPAGMDADLRAGRPVEVVVYGEQASGTARAARAAVAATVGDVAAEAQAARFATQAAGGDFDANLAAARAAERSLPVVGVDARTVDASADFLPEGFAYSAPTMLVLFVFINALAGGAALIQSRQLGIHERMLAGPVAPRAIVLGETICYALIALGQSIVIVGIGALVFGVDWGDPVAAAALVVVWALVGTGAGMLSGTLFRTVEQASSIGPIVGIALGMLGGTMWPLEIVPRAMQVIGHLVPHGWAVDGWVEILSRGGGLGDVALNVAVLAGFATGLLAIAAARLHASLAR